MVRGVGVPVEMVEFDAVLVVVRHERSLGARRNGTRDKYDERKEGNASPIHGYTSEGPMLL
jgi:hypothetical protein